MNHLKSLRDYIEALAAIGEVQEIDRAVNWQLEIGAIARRCYETGAPAPLFNTIKGIEKGFRVLGAPGGVSRQPRLYLSRIALSLGLPPDSTGREIIAALVQARSRSLLPPQLVATGACKENILIGDEVDLLRLPTPLLHDGDGGRYLNTFGIIVAQTPDKRWTNWSIARTMLVDRNRMAGIIAPNQHIGMVRQTWLDINKPMPFALALGVEPFLPFVGGMPLPDYVSEADYAGAYFGEPIDVVQCETVDLQVPATAEIVLEGTIAIADTVPEGPMGEYAGYLWTGQSSPKPVYHVTAMTYRNQPILPISVAGEPVEENHTAWGVPNAAEIVYTLRTAGYPVAMAWSPFESANHWYAIAMERNWRQQMPNTSASELCYKLGEVLFKTKAGMGTPKYIVVNDDIDITNTQEVVWAFATRNYPGSKGEVIFNDEATNPLVAFLEQSEKMSMHTTKVIYNCLPPDEWGDKLPQRSSFTGAYPKDLQERILQNWQAYGFHS
ncbi:MAG: UbiD family decarboxylase [Tildeniella nuda ZEHNDER 1965/U140]|jgi:4-hydroxy-3-polyprenylbenzoate decarboxylase|nr:UbiD family decarboxylase [Tildeniella nuda ZEHNDER 1965/U140]